MESAGIHKIKIPWKALSLLLNKCYTNNYDMYASNTIVILVEIIYRLDGVVVGP